MISRHHWDFVKNKSCQLLEKQYSKSAGHNTRETFQVGYYRGSSKAWDGETLLDQGPTSLLMATFSWWVGTITRCHMMAGIKKCNDTAVMEQLWLRVHSPFFLCSHSLNLISVWIWCHFLSCCRDQIHSLSEAVQQKSPSIQTSEKSSYISK